jgi:protein-disulfide isomerase
MSESNTTSKFLTTVLVLASLGLAAFSIFTLSKASKPEVKVQTIVREEVTKREFMVPVFQLDTDGLSDMVVKKVEAQLAARMEAQVKEMISQAAPAPAPSPTLKAAAAPVAPAVRAAPVVAKPQVKTAVPTPPPLGPVPAGSFKTELGAMPAVGSNDALVYVYILSDFQCPVCKRSAEGLAPLLRDFGDEVRWVFWNNPLDMHSKARSAAAAAMAAFRQGKFWEYHDKLFANNRNLNPQDFLQYATELGLDMERFKKDQADPALNFLFDGTMQAAKLIEAQGTPAFVINGRKQVGWGSAGGIKSMVERELSATKTLVAAGKTPAQARDERARLNTGSAEMFQIYQDYMVKGKIPPQEVE